MDLQNSPHDDFKLGALIGIPAIDRIADAAKDAATQIREKAQLKDALSYIQAGTLDKLTVTHINRLIENNTPPHLYIKAPAYIQRYNNEPNFRLQMQPILASDPLTQTTSLDTTLTGAKTFIQKYLVYIIAIILIGVIIYFIVKRKK